MTKHPRTTENADGRNRLRHNGKESAEYTSMNTRERTCRDLKSAQSGFESLWGTTLTAGHSGSVTHGHLFSPVSVSRVVTTRSKLLAADLKASSWLWAYTLIVNAAEA